MNDRPTGTCTTTGNGLSRSLSREFPAGFEPRWTSHTQTERNGRHRRRIERERDAKRASPALALVWMSSYRVTTGLLGEGVDASQVVCHWRKVEKNTRFGSCLKCPN
uniref:Uncharacterized protein n=1 Tax=Peronospora matthiolae TaxID=2874970 RepID=A0AAV1TII8_9STRA